MTATSIVPPVTDKEIAAPDALATKFPDANVRSTPGSFVEIELPSISTGLFEVPGVVNCAIPSGIIAYTLVEPENFNLLLFFLSFFFATVVADFVSGALGTLTR